MVYKTVNATVVLANPSLSAAEIHGIAAGMLCADAGTPCSAWLTESFADKVFPDSDRVLLERLFAETGRLLASEDFEFDLLLPDDEDDLEQRVAALRNWCQGFLYGVGIAGRNIVKDREIQEIMTDISTLSRLDENAKGEEDEQAYTEIIEYLRAAVMMLRDSCVQKNP